MQVGHHCFMSAAYFQQVDACRTSLCFICAAYYMQVDAGRISLHFCWKTVLWG